MAGKHVQKKGASPRRTESRPERTASGAGTPAGRSADAGFSDRRKTNPTTSAANSSYTSSAGRTPAGAVQTARYAGGRTGTATQARPAAPRTYAVTPERYTVTPEPAYETSRPRRRSPLRIILPILLVLALALGGLCLYVAWQNRLVQERERAAAEEHAQAVRQVAAITTIYPNVYINDINLGELTVEQAVSRLEEAGLDPYRDASITVRLPKDRTLTVTAAELGLGSDLLAPAEEAWAAGRTGSDEDRYEAYLESQTKPTRLTWTAEPTMDETTLRRLVEQAAAAVNIQALESSAEIGTDGITLTKGVEAASVDAEAMFQRVRQAFLDKDFSDITVDFRPVEDTGDSAARDEELLRNVYDTVYTEPVNAQYDKQTGGVLESARGVSFDLDAALAQWQAAQPGEEIFIPYVYTEPEVTELTRELFTDCLAEQSTSLSGSSYGRINNIILAANAMDGAVLNPGESFDYNSCLGERTEARGYMEAGAYSGGKHVTELGGGICQGSSTLYACALYANLQITVRTCHYFVVNYLPRGMDATVSWGGPDFRFVNNRDYPIRIHAWVDGDYLTVQIWGTDTDGTWVDITSETWEDDQFYYAQTYRVVYAADGTQLSSAPEAYSSYHKYEVEEESEEEYYEEEEPEVTEEPIPTPDLPGEDEWSEPAPEVTEPESEYTEPEYTEPEYTEPEYTEPEYTEPEYAEPEHAEDSWTETPAEPEYTEAPAPLEDEGWTDDW